MKTYFSQEIEKPGSGKYSVNYLLEWLGIYLQLAVITLVIYLLQPEENLGLPRFWYLTVGFFTCNAFLPKKYRQYLLLLAFITVLVLFLGVAGGSKVLLLGLLVLGLCHLPIPLWIRKALVILVGTLLVGMVSGVLPALLTNHEIRVFATLFMFRIILYLYEIKHEKESPGVLKRINYFFLLPNIIFPLFPIVDYQEYQKNYYQDDDLKIYQRGVNLISWSLICLMVYRLIYLFGIPKLQDVTGLASVLQYVIATYLTVFRLIGLLSLSVGVLRLFGYDLPRIFNNMFLASSFADLFKRINIYWKDFMTKICYYPIYFRLRKKHPSYALIVSIVVTYLLTWFFHTYQWFWVLGVNPFSANDIIFWVIFGLLGTVNLYFESKAGKNKNSHSFKATFLHSGKVIITFLSMSLMYSMWVSPTFASWMRIVQIALNDSVYNWILFLVVVLLFWLIAGIGYYVYLNRSDHTLKWVSNQRVVGLIFSTSLIVCISFIVSQQSKFKSVELFKKNDRLSEKDDENEFTGYYNEILSVRPDVASKLWGFQKEEKTNEKFEDLDIVRSVNSIMLKELIPNSSGLFKGVEMTSNKWGMRDKHYEKEPAPGTIRIAVIGGSPTFGSGVKNEEVFEQLVENQLNESYGNDSTNFELLNFSVPGTYLLQHSYLLEEKIRFFKPDYILDIEHARPFRGQYRKLLEVVNLNIPLSIELDSFANSISLDLKNARTIPAMHEKGKVIVKWSYNHFIDLCRKYNIQPVWMYLPSIKEGGLPDEFIPLAKASGFKDIIDFRDIFNNYHKNLLLLNKSDGHPNSFAHQIIAKSMYKELIVSLKLGDAKVSNSTTTNTNQKDNE